MGGFSKKIQSKKPSKKTVTIIPRDEWGAQPIKGKVTKLKHPVEYIRYGHTGTPQCKTGYKCVPLLQDYQKTFIDKKYADQPFNFFVGGDGMIYEGRGWDLDADRPEKINKRIRGNSIDIAYVGNFKTADDVPQALIETVKLLIDLALEQNYIQPLSKVLNINDFVPLDI